MPRKKPVNPFYVLLVLAGAAFCVTACAFGLMAFQQVSPLAAGTVEAGIRHPLMAFMDRHGIALMLGELALLAVFTFGAIGTDQYWTGQDDSEESIKSQVPSPKSQ